MNAPGSDVLTLDSLKSLLDSLEEGVLFLDAHRRVRGINAAAARVRDPEAEEVTHVDIAHPHQPMPHGRIRRVGWEQLALFPDEVLHHFAVGVRGTQPLHDFFGFARAQHFMSDEAELPAQILHFGGWRTNRVQQHGGANHGP